jgi:hypothetical protein
VRTCPARRIGDTISGVKAGARLSLAGALFFGLLSGCQASLSADAQVNANGQGASAEGDADLSASGKGEMTRSALASAPSSAETTASDLPASRVLLGARHDLKLKSGQGTASCECLSVALGGARSGGMAWSAVPPAIDEGTQLSIALSSEGQTCKGEPKQSLGASYWGYRISGNNVIVLVEAARGGRPLTSGAIIPKPVDSGQVFVAPTSKKLPYGRSLEGKGLCKIGNPGQVRTAGFSELEMGQNAGPETAAAGAEGRSISDHSTDDAPTTIEIPSN